MVDIFVWLQQRTESEGVVDTSKPVDGWVSGFSAFSITVEKKSFVWLWYLYLCIFFSFLETYFPLTTVYCLCCVLLTVYYYMCVAKNDDNLNLFRLVPCNKYFFIYGVSLLCGSATCEHATEFLTKCEWYCKLQFHVFRKRFFFCKSIRALSLRMIYSNKH